MRLWLLILVGVVATLVGQTHAREIFAPLPHESGEIASAIPASTGEITTVWAYDVPDSLLAAKAPLPDGIPRICFVAGTEIETQTGERPIENLQVGERVLTIDADSSTEVDPVTWRKITLKMPNPEWPSDVLDLELLRSVDWLSSTGWQPGARMWFELEEMGLRGWADVQSVGECPTISRERGRLVLATVTHYNTSVMEVRLKGQAEPLRPTDRHRLFSVTRNDWVPTASLQPGEELRTAEGTACIASVQPWPGMHRVFNIEVETEHSYFAGKSKVLSHNANPCAAPLPPGNSSLWTSTASKTPVENAFGHWQKHGAEFPEFANAKQYVEGTKSFFSNPAAGTLTKVRPNGDILFYNPANNTFGVQSPGGAPRTMFRPRDGINYWNKQ